MTRFALLSLLLSLPACSNDGRDTLDPSTTSGPGSSTGDGSTGEGTTHEGSSSTSGDTEAHGSSETGEVLTTGGDTSSTGEPIEATTGSTGIVATTGDETGEGMTGGDVVCWAGGCGGGEACAPGLSCELHPEAVGLWVCAATCEACAAGALFCDGVIPQGTCIQDGVRKPWCFPDICPGGQDDCAPGAECVDGFCF